MKIGDKIKGFKFSKNSFAKLKYDKEMDSFIDRVGFVVDIDYSFNNIRVEFRVGDAENGAFEDFWFYPFYEGKHHLITNNEFFPIY